MMAYLQTSPKMEAFYEDYVAYLREEKHCSPNTLSAYQRDMQKFFDYAEEFGIASFDGVEASDVSSYKQYLLRRGLSASSVSRSLSALRGLYQYLISVGAAEHNPAREIPNDKVAKKGPQVLTNKEIELLLAQPSPNDLKGIRDKAMLELLYATGIKVSELFAGRGRRQPVASFIVRQRRQGTLYPRLPAGAEGADQLSGIFAPAAGRIRTNGRCSSMSTATG
ncbi:MAG: site-specific integrase [Acutalibacteraceae bacterium]